MLPDRVAFLSCGFSCLTTSVARDLRYKILAGLAWHGLLLAWLAWLAGLLACLRNNKQETTIPSMLKRSKSLEKTLKACRTINIPNLEEI